MDRVLRAVLCQTHQRKPLAAVDLPGPGAELTPAALRSLAAVLVRIADDAEAAPMSVRYFARQRKEYPLAGPEGRVS